MGAVPFATSNAIKFRVAHAVCTAFDVELVQRPLKLVEIQAEDGELIVRDKAAKAFATVGGPVVVNDDCWIIPGLGGFPGPYMKSMNEWLTPEDFLRLTRELADRRVILRQFAAFQDAHGQRVFRADIKGALLSEIRGRDSSANNSLITFDGEHSIAELHNQGKSSISHKQTVWHQLAPWLRDYLAT